MNPMSKFLVYFANTSKATKFVTGKSIETVAKRFFGDGYSLVWDGDGYEVVKNCKILGHIEEKC